MFLNGRGSIRQFSTEVSVSICVLWLERVVISDTASFFAPPDLQHISMADEVAAWYSPDHPVSDTTCWWLCRSQGPRTQEGFWPQLPTGLHRLLHGRDGRCASSIPYPRCVSCLIFFFFCSYLNESWQLGPVFSVTSRKRTQNLVLTWRIWVFVLWTCLGPEQKPLPQRYTGDCCSWSTTLRYKVFTPVGAVSLWSGGSYTLTHSVPCCNCVQRRSKLR